MFVLLNLSGILPFPIFTDLIIQKAKGHGLAQIVEALLRAKGFTTYMSPPGPDKGVDILAHPTEEIMRQRYYYSKLCNLYFTYELCRKLRAKGSHITVNALNPGFMGETNLAGGNMTKERIEQVRQNMPDRFGELPVSSQAAADLLTDDRYLSSEAGYYDRSTKTVSSSPLSYVEENAKELWDESIKLAGLR